MSDGTLWGFISIGFLTIINIVSVAYSYGKLSQKVVDFCSRVERLEGKINGIK